MTNPSLEAGEAFVASPDPYIMVHELTKRFHGHAVLDHVSCSVAKGEVVALIGPSGSGKSTVLRCINGLETPDQGTVTIDGIVFTPKTATTLRRRMGMVFQHFNLFPHMNVLRNISYAPMRVRGASAEHAQRQAAWLLERVGLSQKLYAMPSELSGGQKQRVAIARALAMEPDILLFDEPTSALDPEMTMEVLSAIRALAHTGITMMIVTHEMRFAQEVADRVCFMEHGRILADQPTALFFAQPSHHRAQAFLDAAGYHYPPPIDSPS